MKKIIVTSLVGMACITQAAFAISPTTPAASSVNPANVMNATEKNIPMLEALTPGKLTIGSDSAQHITPSKTALNKLRLKRMVLVGAKHAVPDNVTAVYKKWIGRKVAYEDIQEIARECQQQYRNDGYILVQVVIPPQEIDIHAGIVTLTIVEGNIKTVSLTGDDPKGAKMALDRLAKPIEAEDPLFYHSLDRFLILANALPGINASATLMPDKQETGAADLLVQVKQTKASGFINVNNRGTSYIGPTQASIGGSIYDIVGADALSASMASAVNNPHQMVYANAGYDIVVGSHSTDINASFTETKTQPGSGLSNFDMRGNSIKYNVNINQPLYTSTAQRVTLQSALYRMNSSNNVYINEPLYNDQITALNIGLNYQGVFLKTYHDISLSSTVGLPFNTLTAPSVAGAKSNFVHFNLSTSDIHYFTQRISAAVGSQFQLTPNTLVSSEQIAYGGAAFGQGFIPYVISGDNGALGSVALRYDLPAVGWMGSLQPQIFYDAGVVSFNQTNSVTTKAAFGESAGAGINMRLMNKVQVGLTMAKPLRITQTSGVSMGWQGFFNITGTFS